MSVSRTKCRGTSLQIKRKGEPESGQPSDHADIELCTDNSPVESIRVIALISNEKEFFDMKMIATSFIEAYKQLLAGEPVTCAKTGKQFPTDRKPTVAVYDVRTSVPLVSLYHD